MYDLKINYGSRRKHSTCEFLSCTFVNHELLFICLLFISNNDKWISLLIQWNMFLSNVWFSKRFCNKRYPHAKKSLMLPLLLRNLIVWGITQTISRLRRNVKQGNAHMCYYGGGKQAEDRQAFQGHFLHCIEHLLSANLIWITAAATREPNRKHYHQKFKQNKTLIISQNIFCHT